VNHGDYPAVFPEDKCANYADEIEARWKSVQHTATGDGKAFRSVLGSTFATRYLLWGVALVIKSGIQLYQTQLLSDLIAFLGSRVDGGSFESRSGLPNSGRVEDGYLLAGILALCTFVAAGFHHLMFFFMWRNGMQWRGSVIVSVFRKSMRASLSSVSRGGGPGSLVNLVSSDTEVFQKLAQFGAFFVFGWVELVASAVLLWRENGPSSLAGIGILILILPLQVWFGKLFKRLRTLTAAATDARVQAVRQVVSGIRAVKVSAWEQPMHGRLQEARRKELELVQQASIVRAVNEGIFTVIPAVMGAATFLIRWGLGEQLTARSVFTSLSLFQLMQLMVKFYLMAVEAIGESSASIARLERFMALPEVPTIEDSPTPTADDSPPLIWAKHLNITWFEDNPAGNVAVHSKAVEEAAPVKPELVLRDVSLSVKPGELHIVVGPVAAGKSTLLHSLLGEAREASSSKGRSCGLRGLVGFCPQEPWIVSGSLRQNVLLSRGTRAERHGWDGHALDSDVEGKAWLDTRFQAAVRATGLHLDASAFEDGYDTMLGAQGKRASGGQKARVNLARAVFDPRSEVYLLDDPLSAVDARTTRRIMEHCVQGLLLRRGPEADKYADAHAVVDEEMGKGRLPAVLLATHQLQWLPVADTVTVIARGRVLAQGTPDEVARKIDELLRTSEFEEDAATAAARPRASTDQRTAMSESEFLRAVQSSARGTIDAAGAAHGLDDVATPATAEQATADPAATDQEDVSVAVDESESGEGAASSAIVPVKPKARLEDDEGTTKGSVGWATYFAYMNAAAGPCATLGISTVFLGGAALLLLVSVWLSQWTQLKGGSVHDPNANYFGSTYGIIVAVAVVVCLIRMWLFFAAAVSAGQRLHDRALAALLAAPLRWYEANPVGRIVARFSKDLYLIDTLLPITFEDFLNILTLIIGAVVLVVVSNVWLLIAVIPLAYLLLRLRGYYLLTSREIQRQEAVSRSPVFRLIVEVLDGLDSVRSYNLAGLLNERMSRLVDWNISAFFMFLATSRWLGIRLDFACGLFLVAASFGAVAARDSTGVDPGLIGLSLSLVIQLTGSLQWAFRQSAMLEIQMISVERMLELANVQSEGVVVHAEKSSSAILSKASELPGGAWPPNGQVEFRNVWLQYRPGMPFVLRGVSFGVPSGTLVGVIGRTGAGKSTLVTAMLRLVAYESAVPSREQLEDASTGAEADLTVGSLPADAPKSALDVGIAIGGTDISSVHLTKLRRGVAVIDQSPTLFAGTLRSNIDPFNDYDDESIEKALEAVQMSAAAARRGGLSMKIDEGGTNLSVGERQLVCLARSVLRSVRVQVFDEPTAYSDVQTDKRLQRALRIAARIAKSTVFTVAHRLRTVADHDILIVMKKGEIEEFGSPAWLLRRPDDDSPDVSRGPEGAWGFRRTGAFRDLVGHLGDAEAKAVVDIATGVPDTDEVIDEIDM
jgi:ATP-binding cassette, subfamily C (CFTR/MRP), member 4